MTATIGDDAGLRRWLIDYLITTVGCKPEDIDLDQSLNDLGVSSKDAVLLSGELAELLDRPVSPVDFWQHPTINSLVGFLVGGEPESVGDQLLPFENDSIDEPIAVVGLGCRFPGGITGPDALWDFLWQGRCAVTEVPPQRWLPFDDGSPEVATVLAGTTRWGSFLKDIDAFDAEFFEISLREAAKMDPQQRLLLEVAWEAFEHAGIPAGSLRRSETGVFAGACFSEYGYLGSTYLPAVDAWSNTGGALSIIANRLSYFLDLRGPSITVDTACSSSLVAIHLACQSLRMRDCDMALAAGVNMLMSPAVFHGFDQAAALSPTGMCHAFDAAADGFVRGEGCGAVVLKRLGDAVRDENRILAVVRGSAVNQDGRSNGLMAPNPAAQMAVLKAAYTNAGLAPHDVDYVEAHGTGTFLGDPIEARALGTTLGRGRPVESPLLIGSIKSNLGHQEAAAGVAGFLKAVLALQQARIPGTAGFEMPNPHIPFGALRLKVAAENQDWPSSGQPRRVGVSSFGFGGTNAHVVLEQAPDVAAVGPRQGPAVTTLVVSGKSRERIERLAETLAGWMTGPGAETGLADVAHTLNHHRSTHSTFATVCARHREQAIAGLTALADGQPATGVVGPHDGSCGAGTVFVYSGQGSQWTGMGRQLLADEPAFAAAVAELEPVFVEQVGFSLHEVLAEGRPISGDAQVQPVIMGLQLALTELWRHHGVTPDAVIGHSMGEVSAAVVAEALTVSEGLRVIATRSRLMSTLAGQGAVGLLSLDARATTELIADYPAVSLAVYASPRQTVVAGPPAAVDTLIAEVARRGRFARRVNMEVASHNALMDSILPELRSALADVAPRRPVIPFLSTVQDGTVDPVLNADYWAANIRQPVRLQQAIAAAGETYTRYVEVSAHPMLASAISETLGETHHHSVGTLLRDGDDTVSFHTNLNALHTVQPPVTPHPPGPHPDLPTTPWLHTSHWADFMPMSRQSRQGDPSATSGVVPAEWYCELTWPEQAAATESVPTAASWVVIGDDDVAAAISRTDGARVTTLAEDADDATLLAAAADAEYVLYAPPVNPTFDAASGYRIFTTARRVGVALVEAASQPRLILLTRNAQPIAEGDRANPAHAVLWGLGRTLALECPDIWGAVIDVDESVPAGLVARYAITEAGCGDGEDQIGYRAGVRRVPRLRRALPPSTSGEGLDGNGSYLVVGATGNIGPQLIQQLADMGAGTVVAVSRNPGARLDALTATLAGQGKSLIPVAADASDETAMSELFGRFGVDLPPLAGIYLAAFGGGPATVTDMTDADIAAMFKPKLDAVAVLHKLSLTTSLRQFVVFTSISGLLGSRWLAHYAATTTFLDTFTYARRAAGLPASAINWGLWKSLANSQAEQERNITLGSGLEPMPDEVAIQALWSIAGTRAPVRSTVVAADWTRLATAYRTRAPLHIVDDLLPVDNDENDTADASAVPATQFRKALRECDPEQRYHYLGEHVSTLVTRVMGLASPQLLDRSEGFFQFGMDSLMSVTLQRALAESLGQPVPASVVFDYPTVDALTDYLASILPELIEVAADADVDVYEDLSEDELLQQLSQRLG